MTFKGDPSEIQPGVLKVSPSKAAASSGVYMCPQCDYVTDLEVKLREHMKSTLLHISLMTPEVTVSPPLSTVASSSTSPTFGGGGCAAPILAKTKAALTIISATLLRTQATSHKIENASRKPKDKVVEELWQHYERFHIHKLLLPCSVPIMTRMRVELKMCQIGTLRSEAAAHKIYKYNRKTRGEVVEELWKHYLKYHKTILEGKEPLPIRNLSTSHKSDLGGGGCEAPILAKQKYDLNIHSAELLQPEAAAHKVANASSKPKEKVVEELWQNNTQCHQQDLAPLPNKLVSSSQNEETKCIKCPLCGMYYSPTNKKELEIHNRECNAQKMPELRLGKFKCPICLEFSSNDLSILKAHGERSHPVLEAAMAYMDYTLDEALKDLGDNSDGHICSSCNFISKSTQQLNIHIRKEHHLLGNNPYAKLPRNVKCPHCPHIAKKLGCLQIHVELAHLNHVCTRCDFATMRFKDLGRHLQSAHEVILERKEYWEARKVLREARNRGNKCICAECNLPRMSWARTKDPEFIKELSDPDYRPKKRQPLKKKGKLKCSICSVIQRDVHALEEHENAHKGLRPYSCDKCEASFGSRKTLNHHVSIKHKTEKSGEPSRDKSRDTVCDICKKELCSKKYKEVHMETVHQEGKFKCRFCNEVRKDMDALKGHENAHRGLTPFSCGICGARYSSRGTWRKHQRKHKHQQNMAHLRTEEPLDLRNPSKDIMKYRTKVKCPHCDKFYFSCAQTGTNIMIHLRKKHPEITDHKCPFCDAHAPEFRLLDAHVDAVHKWRWDMKKKVRIQKEGRHFHVKEHTTLNDEETLPYAKCKLCEKGDFDNLLEHLLDCHNITSLDKYEVIASTNFPKNASERRSLTDAAVNSIICDICKKELSSNRLKKRHMKIVHDVDLSIPKCKICGKKRFRSILNHLEEGHNIKSLDEYEEIVKYLPIMTDEKGAKPLSPIRCEICQKELSTLRKKKLHMKVHVPYTIIHEDDINNPEENEVMEQSEENSSECMDSESNSIAAFIRTKIEVMEEIETKPAEKDAKRESNTAEVLSHVETKVEDMEQEETKPTEDGDNGTNRAEAFTHKENKVVVSEQSETKPTEDVDKELNTTEALTHMETRYPHEAKSQADEDSTSHHTAPHSLDNVKTELQEHVRNKIEALDNNDPHSKPEVNDAHDEDVSSDITSHVEDAQKEAADPQHPKKSSCEDVQEAQIVKTPKEVIKYPHKVKCPHCDHLGFSKAYTSNIMFHIKNMHPDILSLKCPFCDETATEYKLLSVHVRAAHKWRWDIRKGRGWYNQQRRQRSYHMKYVRKTQKDEKTLRDITCSHCDDFVYINATKSNILLHLRNSHKEVEKLKCPFCVEITAGFELLMCHVKAAHHKEADVRYVRGKERAKRKAIQLKKLYWGSHPYQIGKRYKNQRARMPVAYNTSKKNVHKCEICDKELTSKKWIERHMKFIHKVDDSTRMCKICHKADFDNLYKHLSECHNVTSLYEYDEVVKHKRNEGDEGLNLTLPTPDWIGLVDKMLGANSIDAQPASVAASRPTESLLVRRSPEVKTPQEINCPHCKNFMDINATKSNIMLHLRDNHKEVESLKCPFCDEFKRDFTMLSHHVQAAHYTNYTNYVNVILGLNNEIPVEDPLSEVKEEPSMSDEQKSLEQHLLNYISTS